VVTGTPASATEWSVDYTPVICTRLSEGGVVIMSGAWWIGYAATFPEKGIVSSRC